METVLVEKKNINEVVELLKQDEVVAFPTETVFGLGVKFGNLSALEKIYEIKHRSHSKAVSNLCCFLLWFWDIYIGERQMPKKNMRKLWQLQARLFATNFLTIRWSG